MFRVKKPSVRCTLAVTKPSQPCGGGSRRPRIGKPLDSHVLVTPAKTLRLQAAGDSRYAGRGRTVGSSLGSACAVSSEHTSFLLPSSPFLGLDEKARPGPGRGRESRWPPQAKHNLPLVLFGERGLTRAAVCPCLPARVTCQQQAVAVVRGRLRDTGHGGIGAAATRGASACVVGVMGLSKPRRPDMGAWNFDLLTRAGGKDTDDCAGARMPERRVTRDCGHQMLWGDEVSSAPLL